MTKQEMEKLERSTRGLSPKNLIRRLLADYKILKNESAKGQEGKIKS